MTPPPALPALLRDQRKVDLGHLQLLAIFHFIGAAFSVIGLLFLFGHFFLLNSVFSHPEFWQTKGKGPPPEVFVGFFGVFKWFYAAVGLWFIASGVLSLLSGWGIHRRKWRQFSIVVAGFNCLHMPLGTVLGVFTIIILARDSVREVYDVQPGAAPAQP